MSHPPKLFLLQMAGESGAGKSTLAGQIAAATGAVVLDMDVVKSAALDAEAGWELAGRMSIFSLWSLAASLLGQGFSVILDQPCRFERIVAEGAAIARRQHACYCFIECVLHDKEEVGRRIRSRTRLRSQMVDYGISSPDAPSGATMADQVREHGPAVLDSKYPDTPWLQVDTQHHPEQCLASALAYLDQRRGERHD